ncbi:MAG: hypothetical protein WA667_00810 [Candidatus Nitrosopolaris sp.]
MLLRLQKLGGVVTGVSSLDNLRKPKLEYEKRECDYGSALRI